MKTTDQLQNPPRTPRTNPPRVMAQTLPREAGQTPTLTPPAGAAVPALIVPEDYRARTVAVQARERILRSPELSALALDGAAIFDRASLAQPLSGSPLRPLLEGAVEEVIAEIDGAPPPGALLGPSRVAPGILSRFMSRTLSRAVPWGKMRGGARGRLPDAYTVFSVGLRAAERGTAPWSYPSVEHVPVDRELALRYLGSELYGFGALDLLLEAGEKFGAAITDIYVNSPCDIWVGIGGEVRPVALSLGNEQRVRALAERLIRRRGGQLDTAHPATDVSDELGRRIHAIIPPLSERTRLSIRLPARERPSLNRLVSAGLCDAATADYLRRMVAERRGFVISGGTGTGKTTLLNALLGLCEPAERIVILEDTPELAPEHEQVVALRTRAANSEGAGAIGLGELIVQALRMGPDRLVVGECRGAEVVHLLTAMNTGHRGAGTTLHANSAEAVPRRLIALGALAGLDYRTVALHTVTAFERIIHLEQKGGRRRIEGVYSLHVEGPEERLRVRKVPIDSEPGLALEPSEPAGGARDRGRA